MICERIDFLGTMQTMGMELDKQNQRIDATGAHAENAHDDIRNVQRGAPVPSHWPGVMALLPWFHETRSSCSSAV